MSFLYPSFLFTLFAITIPIIIHLFNFRNFKTVYFSNVAFLKNIKNETKSKSNLKQILLLISRILVISFLVFAFAQPYIPIESSSKIKKNEQICIYIDNSFSTEAENKYGKISELAKKKAIEIVKAYDTNTKFLYLSNDFNAKHQHLVSKEQIIEFIQETKITPVVRKFSEVTTKAADILSDNTSQHFRLYIISDFQQISSDLDEIAQDSLINIDLIPIFAENTDNLLIDSVWFESPGRLRDQPDKISVKITNYSSESYTDLPIKLFLNDSLKYTSGINIKENESIKTSLSFTNNKTGIIRGRIEIDDYPVTFDNIFYFSYNLSDSIHTLIVSDKNENMYINKVFKDKDQVEIEYRNGSNINSVELSNYDIVIIDELKNLSENFSDKLINYISNGGKFIIFPGINLNIKQYNKLFNRLHTDLISGTDTSTVNAGKLNYQSSLFKNVFKKEEKKPDLPTVKKRIKFNGQSLTEEEIILQSENNDKLISSSRFGKGIVYIFSFSANPTYSNMVYHPLWIPLIYNMVVLNNNQDEIYYTPGKENVIKIKKEQINSESIVKIYNQDRSIDLIPIYSDDKNSNIKVFLNDLIQNAGHYTIETSDANKKGISLNYDRKESNLSFYTSSDIKSYISENNIKNISVTNAKDEYFSEIIQTQNNGKQLWKLFLFAALFFLMSEIIISKMKFIK